MRKLAPFVVAAFLLGVNGAAQAHKLEAAHVPVKVTKSGLTVTPSIDWNGIGGRHGKQSEVWTIDGDRLNELIFLGGLGSGQTLTKAAKHVTLPALQAKTLLVELPDLLERTYRVSRQISDYTQLEAKPRTFLGHDGIAFDYEFVNGDGLHVRGSAVATIIDAKLYMINLNAPRLYYYERSKPAFDAIVESARLS